jgi:hypothetical protein
MLSLVGRPFSEVKKLIVNRMTPKRPSVLQVRLGRYKWDFVKADILLNILQRHQVTMLVTKIYKFKTNVKQTK